MEGLVKEDAKIDLFLTDSDMGNLREKTLEGRLRKGTQMHPITLRLTEQFLNQGCTVKYEENKYNVQITNQIYYMLLGAHHVETPNMNIAYEKSVESKAPHMKKSFEILRNKSI
jgi:hypothetical protein